MRAYTQKVFGMSPSEEAPPAASDEPVLSDSFLFEEHSFVGSPSPTQSALCARSTVSVSPQGVDALDLASAIEQLADLPSDS